MFKNLRWLAITLVLAIMGAQSARATDPPLMVNVQDAPVQLQSITATLDDFMSAVTTKNVSGKTVRSFQLGVIMSIPQGCGPAEVYSAQQVFRIDTVDLAPGVSVQTQDYKLSPVKVYDFKVSNHANAVESELAVVRVDFSDGTSWSITRSGPIYDSKKMNEVAAEQCSKSQ